MQAFLRDNWPYVVAGGLASAIVACLALRRIKPKRVKKSYPRDVVIVHQFVRGPFAPSLSPFCIKLETYLRMANINYQNEMEMVLSAKGKMPWMTYNDVEMADSQFCIDFLTEHLNKDMSRHLSDRERAIARAFLKMVDENLYWCLVLERWVYNIDNWKFIYASLKLPKVFLWKVAKTLGQQACGQGMGRHSMAEVRQVARQDLASLSTFLGDNNFLMGDEPCETDCAIFGMLAEVKWHVPGTPLEKFVNEDLPNLSEYCERMKNRFWPDWDDCTTAGGTREAIA